MIMLLVFPHSLIKKTFCSKHALILIQTVMLIQKEP